MSDSPYAPPSARVADHPHAPQMARPRQVTIAVGLLWTSYALGLPSWYLENARDPDLGFEPLLVIVSAIFFALSAVLIVLVQRRHNWARIALLLLVALEAVVLFWPSEPTVPPGAVEQTLDLVTFAFDIAAMVLLFTRPGAVWFRRRE